MTNNRIYYAVQAARMAPLGDTNFVTIHGLQTLGITTTFNLEQIFEIGQAEIYENIEDVPDIEVTLEKAIDGYPLIYHLATRGFADNTLLGRQNQRSTLNLTIFGDVQNSASGLAVSEVDVSGLYVSSLSYTFPTEGNCTEAVTLVGNNKVWKTSGLFSGTIFDNTDEPLALTSGIGGVQRRENVVFGTVEATRDANGMVDGADATILPPDIPGVSSSGTNFLDPATGTHSAHVGTITVNADLGREELFELGKKGPYFRFASVPIEVTCEIEVTSSTGDGVDAYEEAANLTDRTIKIKLDDSTFLDLGTRNKLSSVTYGGGDAGGGNVTTTFSYQSFNQLDVTHDQDPA